MSENDNMYYITEDSELRRVMDETMDWLSNLPEDELRQVYSEMRFPQGVDFSRTIGGTEYTVISHFNQDAEEAIFNKIARLLETEVAG